MGSNSIDTSQVNSSLLQNQMSGLEKFADSNGTIKSNLSDSEKKELEKAARGFEAIFLNMMLKEMKKGMLDEDSEEKGEISFGADTLSGYTDLLFTDEMSKSGKGMGIAEMIYSQLSGGDKLSTITSKPSTNIIEQLKSVSSSASQTIADSSDNSAVNGNFIDKVSDRLDQYQSIISEASQKYGVPESLIKGIITAESAGKSTAQSSVGAKGLMQLMDGTAKALGVTNSYDPKQNIMAGTQYVKQQLDKFGSVDLAIAAYNAGPGNVSKYDGIPPFKETQSYVAKVKKYSELL
jgi:soluble lytic murein transglycosylase-like protein